jgi:hypothetical protein
MARRICLLLIMICFAAPALAEETPADNPIEPRVTQGTDDTHPIYSNDSHWAGNVIVVIAGLFLAAVVIGPIVRAEAPQAVPPAMSHEEDPAADRH